MRNQSRSGLVERALSVAGAEADLVNLVPCLPSLAMLQVMICEGNENITHQYLWVGLTWFHEMPYTG